MKLWFLSRKLVSLYRGVNQNNPKARANPKELAQLDGYKRPLASEVLARTIKPAAERKNDAVRPGGHDLIGARSFCSLANRLEIENL
jgi:hypothetical protein